MENSEKTKFCKHCGATIPADAVMCTYCGRQVETLNGAEAVQRYQQCKHQHEYKC